MINIILAEDMQLMREGVNSLFKHEDGVTVIAHARDGLEVLDLVEKHKDEVDVIVMDLEMPHKTGLEASAEIMEKYPDKNIRIVILSTHKENVYIRQALKLDIPGYILKDDAYKELLYAVRQVASGEVYYGEELMKLLPKIIKEGESPKQILSKSEIDNLKLLNQGFTTAEIADKLHISPNTVHTHLRNMRKKLNVRNKVELLNAAKKLSLLDP